MWGNCISFHHFQVCGSLVYYSLALFLCLKISCSTKLKKKKIKCLHQTKNLSQQLQKTTLQKSTMIYSIWYSSCSKWEFLCIIPTFYDWQAVCFLIQRDGRLAPKACLLSHALREFSQFNSNKMIAWFRSSQGMKNV